MLFQRVGNKPTYMYPDYYYPQNVIAVAVNPEIAAAPGARAAFSFSVLAENVMIVVRNINTVGLETLVAYYNLIQIK
jgi:hypothetical protein